MDFPDVHVHAAGSALPGPPITNTMLARRFGMGQLWEQWVDAFIGTRSRHLAVDLDTGEVRYSLADLGATAAQQALSRAGIPPDEVDLIVMGTATPDALMPATVTVIADRLGINNLPAYQLQSGCTGAVQALDVARQMLLTGRHHTALVISGDSCAKHYDVTLNLAEVPPAEQVNGLLFGDGAGAAVLSVERAAGAARIRHLLVELTGLNRAPGQTVEWFGLADRGSGRPGGAEDYKAIEESVPTMATETLDRLLADLDWKRGDLNYLLPPQLSGRMTARITQQLATPEAQEVSCVATTGNAGNAMPLLQLERVLPRMSKGDRAALVAIESSKWIKACMALEKT